MLGLGLTLVLLLALIAVTYIRNIYTGVSYIKKSNEELIDSCILSTTIPLCLRTHSSL